MKKFLTWLIMWMREGNGFFSIRALETYRCRSQLFCVFTLDLSHKFFELTICHIFLCKKLIFGVIFSIWLCILLINFEQILWALHDLNKLHEPIPWECLCLIILFNLIQMPHKLLLIKIHAFNQLRYFFLTQFICLIPIILHIVSQNERIILRLRMKLCVIFLHSDKQIENMLMLLPVIKN